MDEKIESRIDSIQRWKKLLLQIHDSREDTEVVHEAKENLLRKIVEAVIDIASRIIALEEFRRPDTYSEYFEVLQEEDVVSEDLSKSLVEMAQFRNLMIHQYHKIKLEELNSIIDDDLGDIQNFISQLIKYYEGEYI